MVLLGGWMGGWVDATRERYDIIGGFLSFVQGTSKGLCAKITIGCFLSFVQVGAVRENKIPVMVYG